MSEQGDFVLQQIVAILEDYNGRTGTRFMVIDIERTFLERTQDIEFNSNFRPLTEFTLVPLHSRVLRDDDVEKNCVICLEEQKCKQAVKDLPCKHVFHSECIDNWLLANYNCPLCRTDLRQNPNI
uniref:RING-type domain-containing protein n=1 Tax=Strigamia maritima TaxID=126957 RepID=T1J8S5_STRMM